MSWSDLPNTSAIDPEYLLKMGMNALASGKVSASEAQKNISPFLKGTKQSPILTAKRKPSAPMVGDVNTPAPGTEGAVYDKDVVALPQMAPVAKGSGFANEQQALQKQTDTDKNTNKLVDLKNQYLSPEELNSLYDRTAGLETFKEQRGGIDKMRELLAMEQSAPTDYLSGPLTGLLETEFGRKVGAMQKGAGQSPEEQRQKILAYAQKIQGDQSSLSKNIFDAINKQRSGSTTSSLAQELATNNLIQSLNQQKQTDPNAFMKSGPKAYDPNKDIQTLGKERAKTASGVLKSFDDLDKELAPDGGLAALRDSNKGVKGAGGWNGLVPIAWRGDKQARIFNIARDLAMQKLQMRSGAQASQQEADRYLSQFGLTVTASPREMATGLTKLVDDVQAQLAADEARFPKEAVQKYASTPGRIMSTDIDKYKQARPKAPAGKKASDMSEAELDAFLKANGG